MTVNFYQCYIDVTKLKTHSLYVIFTNKMLQCYSVIAYPLTKNKKNMFTFLGYLVVLRSALVVTLMLQ